MTRRFFCALALWAGAGMAQAQELRLAAPVEMVESGFLKHILPRFKLKHRITVLPVAPDAAADMEIAAQEGAGRQVFATVAGQPFWLVVAEGDTGAEKFLDWITSTPGRSAIESFPRGGPSIYTTNLPEPEVEEAVELTGDAALGARLALVHCGRCHVVDQRNRMGGIGSTPSFGALRARAAWIELFTIYYTQNPHPSFTEVIGVTEPFGDRNVSHIAPVRITLDEVDAIVAFVETLEPKDLGRPIQSQ